MRWCNYLLVLAVLAAVAGPVSATGLFGNRKPPANPAERVRQLVAAVQTSRDDNDRTEAVQQLREFDAVAYPVVVPSLVNVLRTDKAVGVRIEAARSLGRVRPLTGKARDALFEASLHDSAFRVRWQARTSLTYYTVANVNPYNHSSSQTAQPTAGAGKEPVVSSVPNTPPGGARPVFVPSVQPGLPRPGSTGYARPLPKGPAQAGTVIPPATREPPLAPVVPVPPATMIVPPAPVPPAAKVVAPPVLNPNPTVPVWVAAPNPSLPTVPPVTGVPTMPAVMPSTGPTQGPILAPPQ